MQKLYCISGLGADEKAFQYLDLSFASPVYITWIKPLPNETLQSYALRLMQEFIWEANPFILGLSLGGMLATEIMKQLPTAKVVIISSAKTKDELPFYWRIFKSLPLYKMIPEKIFRQSSGIQEYFLSAKDTASRQYLQKALKKADPNFYRWAIGAIINWKNKTAPKGVIHIHGDKDRLLPIRFVKPDFIIKNGGHLMVIENAKEISVILKQIFTEKSSADELNLALQS